MSIRTSGTAVGVVARRKWSIGTTSHLGRSAASRMWHSSNTTGTSHRQGLSAPPFNHPAPRQQWCVPSSRNTGRYGRSVSSSSSSSNSNTSGGPRNENEPSGVAASDDTKEEPLTDQQLLDSVEEIAEVDSKLIEAIIDRTLFTQRIPVKMPDMGTGETSKVMKWYFAPGEVIQRGNVLCDIETPGFTFGMETDDEELAIMGETLVELGQAVPLNSIICNLYHEAPVVDDTTKETSEQSSVSTDAKEDTGTGNKNTL